MNKCRSAKEEENEGKEERINLVSARIINKR